jgi:hypothetical protein
MQRSLLTTFFLLLLLIVHWAGTGGSLLSRTFSFILGLGEYLVCFVSSFGGEGEWKGDGGVRMDGVL